MNDTVLLYISAICSVIAIIVLLVDWFLDLREKNCKTSPELEEKIAKLRDALRGNKNEI
jgi:hypothetical protein